MNYTLLPIKSKVSAERSEADIRPTGGYPSSANSLYSEVKELISNQWDMYPPAWFIVIQWTPAPMNHPAVVGHAKHFRNKLLSSVYNCQIRQVPPAEDRFKMVWFHERALDPRGHIIWHSNLHLEALPGPCPGSVIYLESIITTKVAPHFRSLRNLSRKEDPALVIKKWKYDQHAFYNLKDYWKFKYSQDPDLALDYENSDLI